MKKSDDEETEKVDVMQQMDLLWNVEDDPEYSLFCDIGSAFAESYVIDTPVQVNDRLDSCFIFENSDIEVNMYWLECIYMLPAMDQSPLKRVENDPSLGGFQTRLQMDQYNSLNAVRSFNKTREMLSTTLWQAPECNRDLLNNFAAAELRIKGTSKISPEAYDRLYMLLSAIQFTNDYKADDSRVSNTLHTIRAQNEIDKMKKMLGKGSGSSSPPNHDKFKCKKYETCDKMNPAEDDVTLSDAVKIAVKKQLNM